jgi:hypothetical protein
MAAVLYGLIARHESWGGPPVWPVAVGTAALTAVCAVGFTAGAFFPGRFTAPLAGVGAFLVSLVAFRNAVGSTGGATLLSPSASVPISDAGTFYHALPDLPIAQVMFLAGVAAAAVGVLGLPAAAGGRRLRRVAAAVTVTGLVAAGTAVGLTSTARLAAHGVVILALHDAASDRPIRYPPVCGGSAIPVCVHPAFRGCLLQVATALDPVLREVAGLPGAPVSAVQVAASNLGDPAAIFGSPPAYHFTMLDAPRSPGAQGDFFAGSLRISVVLVLVTGSPGPGGLSGTQAQQAVEAVLLRAVGVRDRRTHSADRAVSAAARRFAALPAAARHAWLMANLAALRAGHVTVSQLP